MTIEGAMFTHTRNKAAVTSRSVSPGVRWHAGSPGVRWHAGSRRVLFGCELCTMFSNVFLFSKVGSDFDVGRTQLG